MLSFFNKSKREIYIILLEGIILCAILMPVLVLSMYAVPVKDDFSTAVRVQQELGESGMLVASLRVTASRWISWGGFYSALFFNYWLNPYMRMGIWGLRITILMINIFFAFSIYFFIKCILKYLFEITSTKIYLAFYLPILFMFVNNYLNEEIFFWYCVSVSYVLLTSIMLLGFTFCMRAIKNNSLFYAVLAAVMGIIVSGASLNMAALNCGVYLIICVFGVCFLKRKLVPAICFCSTLAGAILNVASPGNFTRHESLSTDYMILGSLINSMKIVYERLNYMLSETPYFAICVLLFILCIYFVKYDEISFQFKWPGFIILICLAGGVIVNFPVVLGYGVGYFPDRCVFVMDCWLYLSSIVIIGYFAGWCKKTRKLLTVRKDMLIAVIISICFWACSFGILDYVRNCPSVAYAKVLLSGEAKEYAQYWEGIFEEIETSENEVIVIERTWLANNSIAISVGIGDNADNWVNSAVASYFGKSAVTIEIVND